MTEAIGIQPRPEAYPYTLPEALDRRGVSLPEPAKPAPARERPDFERDRNDSQRVIASIKARDSGPDNRTSHGP